MGVTETSAAYFDEINANLYGGSLQVARECGNVIASETPFSRQGDEEIIKMLRKEGEMIHRLAEKIQGDQPGSIL